ncbi:MAG: DsbA family protein [Maricaulaceae bacterium]|nr:DsbA family protein [Maricaulaceae bacterium]
MFRLLIALCAAALLASCGETRQQGPDASLTDAQRDEVRQLVRETLVSNPQIIEEAIIELQRLARQREADMALAMVQANETLIYGDGRDPRIGEAGAPVRIVEFVDYNCGFCRVAARWVQSAMERNPEQVQLIVKEYPILSESSVEAAHAALAVWRQGKDVYGRFHMAMVQATGALTADRIDTFAEEAGADVARMRADMEDPEIEAHLGDVMRLGRILGIDGTPFFIIGDQVVFGANERALDEALAAALAAAGE